MFWKFQVAYFQRFWFTHKKVILKIDNKVSVFFEILSPIIGLIDRGSLFWLSALADLLRHWFIVWCNPLYVAEQLGIFGFVMLYLWTRLNWWCKIITWEKPIQNAIQRWTVFHMPELISIKQGRGHPKNVTDWYKKKHVKFKWNLYGTWLNKWYWII